MVSVWSTAWLHRNLTEQKVQKRNRSRTLIDYLEIYFAPPPPPPPPPCTDQLSQLYMIFLPCTIVRVVLVSHVYSVQLYITDNQMMYSTLVMMTKLTFKAASKAALSSVIIKMQYLKGQFQLVPKLHNNLSSI